MGIFFFIMKTPDYSLYLATDTDLCHPRDLCQCVEEAIAAGVTVVQLREKKYSAQYAYDLGKKLLAITRHYDIPLIINDRVDLMLALDADGVHLGRTDLPLDIGRKLIGKNKIMGYSVNTHLHLEHAINRGADYVGIGPIFPTQTKTDTAEAIGLNGITKLTSQSPIPCVAIGSVNTTNCTDIIKAGAHGICVISAILTAPNIAAQTQQLRQLIHNARQN